MPCAQTVPGLLDTSQKARIMFEAIFEPFLFRLKTDQHAGRFAVARDDDFLRFRFSEEPR
jgi:hypothetical protein